MTDKIRRSVITSGMFALVSSLLASLIITMLVYFEVVKITLALKILYGAFVSIVFMTSFISARKIATRGVVIGLVTASVFIAFSGLYHFRAMNGLGLVFGIRSAITLVVATAGAIIGVNASK